MDIPIPAQVSLRLAPPVSAGGRLLVPLVRLSCAALGTGGMAHCTPVALLVGEGETWYLVPLEEGIGREVLEGLSLPGSTPANRP